jgi:hypothetical protein
METLSKQDLGVFALEFLDNLTDVDAEAGEERVYYSAMFLVADLDEDGDIRILMRTTSDNGLSNVRVLQEAQLQQVLAMLEGGDA